MWPERGSPAVDVAAEVHEVQDVRGREHLGSDRLAAATQTWHPGAEGPRDERGRTLTRRPNRLRCRRGLRQEASGGFPPCCPGRPPSRDGVPPSGRGPRGEPRGRAQGEPRGSPGGAQGEPRGSRTALTRQRPAAPASRAAGPRARRGSRAGRWPRLRTRPGQALANAQDFQTKRPKVSASATRLVFARRVKFKSVSLHWLRCAVCYLHHVR